MATYAGRYDEVLLRKAGNRLAPPVANTTVLVYQSDGSTTATLYTDRTKATTAANPVSVDASGNLEFFAEPGTYVLSIRESGSQVATNTVTVLNDPAESTGGGGATNLTWTASTSTVASDTGTDAVLTAVDATNPGLMTVAQSNKLAGIETAATADQTAAELLTAIKTVDGSGSGLDADLLRGTTPSAFGLTVLDDADAATARTTLGAEATLNAAGVVAKFTGTPDGTKFLRDDGTLVTPAGGGGGGAVEVISRTVLASAAAVVDLTAIPATYEHLELTISGSGDNASATVVLNVRLNGDTATNYQHQTVHGTGTTTGAASAVTQAQARIGFIVGASAASGAGSIVQARILGYARTATKVLLASAYGRWGATTTGQQVEHSAGYWTGTAAVNQITVIPASGNLAAGTVVTLYGIKGA